MTVATVALLSYVRGVETRTQEELEPVDAFVAAEPIPAGTDADYFILSFAEELDASIVSNDRFRDRIKQYPNLRKRVIKYMIVQGEVVFEKRTGRRE
jgi:hypothetical protein